METLFKELLRRGNSIVTSGDIYLLFPNLNENAIQARIKRSLKSRELIRLYKGVYAINSEFSKKPVLEENVAQAIDENAFLSGMGALRFHNLVPETISFKSFRGTKSAKVDLGNIHFEIKKLPIDQTTFGIDTVTIADGKFRVADPVRAIMDVFSEQKLSPTNRHQICSFLRIDEDEAAEISWDKAPDYAKKINSKSAHAIAAAMMNP